MASNRPLGRGPDELRKITITRQFTELPPGSVLIEFGKTRVLCTATWTDGVPPFLATMDQGWLTAEYAMIPAAGTGRTPRDRGGKTDGRAVEIQRLIGRSLRAIVDLGALPRKTIWLDCDVLQADGGTRCAAICGAYVALVDCVLEMDRQKLLKRWPVLGAVGAVSVGVVSGEPRLDLCYTEDVDAEVDANIVMNDRMEFLEVQATSEKKPLAKPGLDSLLALAEGGIQKIFALQKQTLGAVKRG
ncbi:MAG: ribonuclease PH [Planctomycetes bacterium]|nr:ribonuclease PH [Planctomycetota bacterium]